MPPKHIAQTSTEVKKAYKQNGPAISDRTHKQLQRGYELEQRAARERETEQRRKLAKGKRIEREKKEEQIRKQIGVGLATQLIGYSHTQANLKKGMEAFLGISKKRQDEERRRKENDKQREEELARKLEVIAQDIEKEPFDDDEDMDDAMLEFSLANAQDEGGWVDDELDDDTLLEAHDLIMSDPMEEADRESIPDPARSTTAPPAPQNQTFSDVQDAKSVVPAQATRCEPQEENATCEDAEFQRTHGPVNRIVESALERLPGKFIELLSQDTATITSEWTPSHSLLYKLNPIGLPPHRLRVKVGCVVVCLRDLNTSSQLSKSQHVRILRVENERLECLTLDGQLAGTRTVITRVPFPARYRNDTRFPFTRTQYPVRVATDYISPDPPHNVQPSGFKLPSIHGKVRPPILFKRPIPPLSNAKSQASSNPIFKLPGIPASKAQPSDCSWSVAPLQTTTTALVALDGWDDFLESGTQIARELFAEADPNHAQSGSSSKPLPVIESVPPLSTQDLDFSLDDLDDESPHVQEQDLKVEPRTKGGLRVAKAAVPSRGVRSPLSVKPGPLSRTANIRRLDQELIYTPTPSVRPAKAWPPRAKRPMASALNDLTPAKKPCLKPAALSTITASTTNSRLFSDFGISTQEASSFFDDDDELACGSPPIAV